MKFKIIVNFLILLISFTEVFAGGGSAPAKPISCDAHFPSLTAVSKQDTIPYAFIWSGAYRSVSAGLGTTITATPDGEARHLDSFFGGHEYVYDSPGVLLQNVASVSAGTHYCAVLTTGQAKCWGNNTSGSLGNGSMNGNPFFYPTFVMENATQIQNGIVSISASEWFTCAVLSSGQVKCWGYNFFGQLGNNTTIDHSYPELVQDSGGGFLSGVIKISTGRRHACALLSSGQVKCWGDNTYGSLGDGTIGAVYDYYGSMPLARRLRAVTVQASSGGNLTGVTDISSGHYHTCTRLNTSEVKCWGYNGVGALGDGTTTVRTKAVSVFNLGTSGSKLSGVSSVAAGDFFSCALLSTSEVKCWGSNAGLGQNLPYQYYKLNPDYVLNASLSRLSGVNQMDAGQFHACAVLNSGNISCWGSSLAWEAPGYYPNDTSHVAIPVSP